MNNKKTKIALLLGGDSTEREVSKSSAKSIYGALINLGYEVVLVDPAYGTNQPENETDFFTEKDYAPVCAGNYIEAINSPLFDDIRLAFVGLHGKYGEDGIIQSLLELKGITYTGSKILASSLSMDKIMTKITFKHYGIGTPEWFSIEKNSASYDAIPEMIKKGFGFPCVIKPNDQGSTVGLTICKDSSEVAAALKLAHQYSIKALIEEYIEGLEVTVGVIEQTALPVLEIKPKHGLYDYECKYTSGMSDYIVPAELPKEVAQRLQSQALLAFNSLDCKGYGRLDFRVNSKYETYCLEMNTLPGMTSTSLVPKMAKAVGIPFDDLIARIIKLA